MTLHESKAAMSRLVSNRNGAKRRFEDGDGFYDEIHFNRMFELEIKRTKLSRRPFILILINISSLNTSRTFDRLNKLKKSFLSDFRETDILGWYRQDSILGIVFTELGSAGHDTREVLFGKTLAALNSQLGPDELQKIYITFHSYPKDLEHSIGSGRFDLQIDHDIARDKSAKPSSSKLTRLAELVGGFPELMRLASGYFSRTTPKV
jgi:hypothetical protein